MLEDASVTTTISPPTEAVALDLDLDLEVNANCPSPAIAKQHQEHREPSKLSHPAKECSAENTVWKPSNRSPTLGTTAPDTWAGPWGGPGSGPGPGPNQWLVPMMSPTEGLVYKPCPGPVFRSSALMGSFPNQGFAYPHQPFFPSYYGMMPVAVSRQGSEEMNLEPVSFETNHCNASKECAADFQGSTPSSPIKKAAKTSLENRGVVSNNQSSELNHQLPRRVIKAVPHNRRSASESVARIFRSIQEERKR